MLKLEVFLWVTVNMSRRNILLVTKLAYVRICNATLTGVYNIALYLCFFIFNFCKLLLSTNEVLYLQKQPLVGTLQKQLLLILTNIDINSFMITAGNYLFFVEHFCSTFGVFFLGERGFNHFQALNTSTKS